MSAGVFRLYVNEGKGWGLLQSFMYDDAARRPSDRRDKVLDDAMTVREGWSSRYKRFAEAAFCLEEQQEDWRKARFVSGTPR